MPWHYRIRKRILDKKPWFDIVEYFVSGKSRGWTKEGMAPEGETREEVIQCLKMMLKDALTRKTLIDKENYGSE